MTTGRDRPRCAASAEPGASRPRPPIANRPGTIASSETPSGFQNPSTSAAANATRTRNPPVPPIGPVTSSFCWSAHSFVRDSKESSCFCSRFPALTSPGPRGEAVRLLADERGEPGGDLVDVRPGPLPRRPQGPVAVVPLHRQHPLLGGVEHRGDELVPTHLLLEDVRRLRGTDPGRRRVLQREAGRRLVRAPGGAGPQRESHQAGQHEQQPPAARTAAPGRSAAPSRRSRPASAAPAGRRRSAR